MDRDKRESIGCLVATVVIIGLIAGVVRLFSEEFEAGAATVAILVLLCLPTYVLVRQRQYRKNLEIRYEVQRRLEDCAEELQGLAQELGEYNPQNTDEEPGEYLDGIKEGMSSLAEEIKELADRLCE